MQTHSFENSSFRDPAGFVFYDQNLVLRQINKSYKEHYELLVNSGLLDDLWEKKLLIRHKTLDNHKGITDDALLVVEPEHISFISYPYEWSFTQIKDAALCTLEVQKAALSKGMILKDASAYNIQFQKGMPIFIDTLSFEKYNENQPWKAYRQFCQHFLAPLTLMIYTHTSLNSLLKIHLDGIPLELTSKLLPWKTRMNLPIYIHIHLHASLQKSSISKKQTSRAGKLPVSKILSLTESLVQLIESLEQKDKKSQWSAYYTFTNYSELAFSSKKKIVTEMLSKVKAQRLWDLGANTGMYTRIAAAMGMQCIAFDMDSMVIDRIYRQNREQGIKNVLPLIMDLTNPSPGIGWDNLERLPLSGRQKPNIIMALAFIHHLAISNNIPFSKIGEFLASLSQYVIIEFVPKSDSQVQKLLESREDVFDLYHEEEFVRAFSLFFIIIERTQIEDSQRSIFLMQKKEISEIGID